MVVVLYVAYLGKLKREGKEITALPTLVLLPPSLLPQTFVEATESFGDDLDVYVWFDHKRSLNIRDPRREGMLGQTGFDKLMASCIRGKDNPDTAKVVILAAWSTMSSRWVSTLDSPYDRKDPASLKERDTFEPRPTPCCWHQDRHLCHRRRPFHHDRIGPNDVGFSTTTLPPPSYEEVDTLQPFNSKPPSPLPKGVSSSPALCPVPFGHSLLFQPRLSLPPPLRREELGKGRWKLANASFQPI
ncbi:hypothetical protein B0T20DRAFT_398523 [Sordaria brevicollis]|uniref:Uncharacterized protein n=1 Tax=Sordaria brevicollis TaxID=83679 RepID=A0AAE0PMN5_SORBR|nr:hypothetical protein B0T20DRAFT_398523 [Sordaria brevicollis]